MKFLRILSSILSEVLVTISYLRPKDTKKKLVVEQYPDLISGRSVTDMFPKFRGHLQNDLNKCTGCGDCLAVCPVRALQMDARVERDGSVVVDSFSIDLGRCFSCGACIDICAPASITYSRKYEMAADAQAGLISVIRDKKAGSTVEAPRIRSYEVRR